MLKIGLVLSPSLQVSSFNNDAIRSTSLTRNSLVQVTQRYYDAAGLIRRNKDYVANEAVYLMKEKFPYFRSSCGEINCEDDIRDILDSIILDLENGSNSHGLGFFFSVC